MRYLEIINEGRDAPLYHGIRNPKFAIMALSNNEIAATSSQRFWKDGKRRKDNDPEYEDSFWCKGVSASRDLEFAKSWAGIVFVLDQTIISRNYKIIPLHWGYSIPSGSNHKREREEFIVVKSTFDTYMEPDVQDGDDPNDPLPPKFNYERFSNPEGSIKPLNKFLIGILLDKQYGKMYGEKMKPIIDHPKFLGYFESARK